MSGQGILSLGGALVGGLFGGLPGARIGFTLGSIAGNYLFAPSGPNQQGPRLQNLETTNANEGAPLPIVYASVRAPATAIWSNGIEETQNTESFGGKGAGGGGGSQTTYTYSASFAVSLCEGPIVGVRRIWCDTKLIYDRRETADVESIVASSESAGDIRIYLGTESQTADPLISAVEGAANTPAFRGVAYIVFEDLQLADFGNRIPSITAEVVNGAKTDPPVKIVDFTQTQGSTIGIGSIEYVDGIWRSASVTTGSPTASQNTWTIKSYNLNGDLLLTEQRVGSNINNATNVGAGVTFNGNVELGFMRQEAAGTGSTTGTWGAYGYGYEGLLVPAAPRPFSPDGFLGSGSFDYYRAIGGGIYWNGKIYAENYGTSNEFGIAIYPPGTSTTPFPSTIPSGFFELDDWLAAGSAAQLAFNAGDDGYLYVNTLDGGQFLDGSEVLKFDAELNLIASFAVEGGLGSGQRLAVWSDIMATMTKETITSDPSAAVIYDVSDEQILSSPYVAPIINSVQNDIGIEQQYPAYGIGGGLWISEDGVWSMNPALNAGTTTLQAIVEDICGRCDLAPGEIDATDLSPIVNGYIIDRPMPGRAAIEGLIPAYFFDGFESGVGVKFTLRGGASVATISDAELGAHVTTPPIGPITRTRQQEIELPQQVDVLYNDSGQDYQIGAQRAQRIITTSINQVQLQLPVVMSSTQAAQAADIYLQSVWAERDRWSLSLGRAYKYLEPADLITVSTLTGNVLVRITAIAEGADGVLEIQGVTDLSTLYSSVAVGNDAGLEVEQSIALKGPTNFTLIDLRQLRDLAADDTPGYYFAGSGYYTGWRGASVYREDDGEDPTYVGTILAGALVGTANDALNDYALQEIDVSATVNVSIIGPGSLASITEAQLLAGGNAALIGNEIVYFRDVTLESDGSYTLRRFIRGVGSTSMVGHVAGDRFVLLTTATLRTAEGSLADTDAATTFKVWTVAAASVGPTVIPATLENNRIRPVPPAHAYANRESNGDYVGQFVRQARSNTEWIDNVDTPLDETAEVYEIDVLDAGSPTTVLRTIDATAPEFSYTRAQQLADFGAVQSSVEFAAYQMSDRRGRGFPAYFTGTTPAAGWSSFDSLVIADAPVSFILMNSKYKLVGLSDHTWKDWEHQDGSEGVEYAYTGASPFADDLSPVFEAISGDVNFQIEPNASQMNQITDGLTIEFLIRGTWNTTGNFINLASRGDYSNRSGSNSCYFCFLQTNNRDDLIFEVTPSTTSEELISSGAGLNDGDWHHVVCVWDNVIGGTHTQYIYVDGVENISQSIVVTEGQSIYTPSTTVRAECGEVPSQGVDVSFPGTRTRLAFYDYPFTAAQVAAHFAATGL